MWRGSAVAALLTLVAAPAAAQCTTHAAEIIDVLYVRILERPPDAQSQQLTQELTSGRVPVKYVVSALAKSHEHLTRLWLPVVNAAFLQVRNAAPERDRALDVARTLALGGRTLDETTIALAVEETATLNPETAVMALYNRLLGRDPSPEDVERQAQAFARDGVEPLVRAIITSAEFRERFGRNTVPVHGAHAYDAPLRTLYRELLNREPDPEGLAQHAQVAAQSGFGTVVDQMLGSAEYQRLFGPQGIPGAAAGKTPYCGVP
jgi:hypothetical protein